MGRSVNKVTLLGNVGSEPDLKTTAGGVRFAKFSLATNRKYKDRSGQMVDDTQWHRITAWDKLADIIERYVKKGDPIYIEGRIEYSTTGEGDSMKYWTDIIASEVTLLGSRSHDEDPF